MSDTEKLAVALGDRYVIERELGAGGMATVYLAKDRKHDREVALKVLRPELGAVLGAERFLAEIKISARLDHPHILTLIDSGAAEGFLYYVLPYVRGESLRARLNRERQLGLDEALTITRQVAGALDYAHRQGVVHRDIKPENILIQEGEAMLADFGIALAVKEAGGNRLTESGLSLGTPQYMSPEQATGDRQLDARSDVYSLAAVLYEMLAGEPPVTGPTVQAVIAKLLTERPTRVRTVRDTVPEGVDAAVAKALAKTPADRFPTAGDFARALEVRPEPAAVPRRRRPLALVVGVVGIALVAALGALLATGRLARRGPAFALRDRTQLTFSGSVLLSAISPDGKQLAYFTKECTETACSYATDVQDVGGTTTHRILDHATAAYGLWWSPDRRNLMVNATINGRYGIFLLSALGGAPRYLTSSSAEFWAGGDSLLVGPAYRADSVFYVQVASLDGVVRDSIRVPGPGAGLWAITAEPATGWIVTLFRQAGHDVSQVMDRYGKVADRVVGSRTAWFQATSGALWLMRSGPVSEAIVRMALDPASGRLSPREDIVFSGSFANFTVTADGAALVTTEGTYEYGVWALPLADALAGRFPPSRRVLRTSTFASAGVSPDGSRLLVERALPSSSGTSAIRLSVMPFDGGPETPLSGQGSPVRAFWTDSVTAAVSTHTARGMRLALVDVRTGAQRRALDVPDSMVVDFAPLPDGWAWIPAAADRLIVQDSGRAREIPKPSWFGPLTQIAVDRGGRRLLFVGWNAGTVDTLGTAVVSLDEGAPVLWATAFAESGYARFLPDGSVVFAVWPTQESEVLYRVRGPGELQRLGAVPRPVVGLGFSDDLKRATVMERSYRGDAWMSNVVRP
jgi:hypothetical protein